MRIAARLILVVAVTAGVAAWGGMAQLEGARAQDSGAPALPAPATLMPEIPALDAWRRSPHADITQEAFRRWDTEDDKMIPETCAKCHSTSGFIDYLGADGSAAGTVDTKHSPDPAVAPGIACMACHNNVARTMTVVSFPSGVKQDVLTPDARCMTCHGGRASTVQVNAEIAKAGNPGEDQAVAEMSFVNIHYVAAAASRFGSDVHGGFEYDGKPYAGYYFHDRESQTCNDCHSPHTLDVKVTSCTKCHDQVVAEDNKSLRKIRTSKVDFDGNGDIGEGIDAEIKALHGLLLEAIKGYARQVASTEIAYHDHAYPYFFVDSDGSGVIEDGEAKFPNRYQAWTPRHLKAAYNYQFVAKDKGVFTHNPRYALQLLHDSIADLADAGSGVAVSGTRPD